jgi:hypothetical protein
MEKDIHGTRSRYALHRCRCLKCRAANSRYQTMRAARELGAYKVFALNGNGQRGWIVRRRSDGEIVMRTQVRSDAYRRCNLYNRRSSRDREPHWADAALIAKVREHINALNAAGVGCHAIERSCWLTRSRLQELKHGVSHNSKRPRIRRLKFRTAQTILAVRADDVTPAGGTIIAADKAWRLIGELIAAGMTKAAIARGIGQRGPGLQVHRGRICYRTAESIRRLHESTFQNEASA